MEDETLIALIKSHPVLYNYENNKYRDARYKDQIWGIIAKQLNVSVATCKSRWTSLRDQYKRNKKRKGQFIVGKKRWRYDTEMSFLIPFLKDRNGNAENDNDMDDDDDSFTTNSIFGKIEEVTTNRLDLDEITNGATDLGNSTLKVKSSRKLQHFSPSSLDVLQKSSADTLSPIPIEYVVGEPSQSQLRSPNSRDPTDILFETVAEKVKRFTPYYKNLAESKIFALVQELELEQIMQKEHDHTTPNGSRRKSFSKNQLYNNKSTKTRNSTPELITSPTSDPLYNGEDDI